jgi:hypothetical protein
MSTTASTPLAAESVSSPTLELFEPVFPSLVG